MTRRPNTRTDTLHGLAWAAMVTLAVVVVLVVGAAPPAHAQDGLGAELYPPSPTITDEDHGIFPVANYDIGCANSGFFGDIACVTLGAATNLAFAAGKLKVALSVWLLEAAIGFTLEQSLTDAATTVADLLDRRILGPINLAHFGLVVSALYMGWQFLRGRVGAGAGEFALSLTVLAVLIHISTGPGFGQIVTGSIEAAGAISADIVTLAADTNTPGDAVDGVGTALVGGFVRDPYDTINWGRPLTNTECAAARNQILTSGPHGYDDTARQAMTGAGCGAEAEFNAHAGADRLIGAILYAASTVVALVLLVVTAFTLVVAKGLAVVLVALLPVALYAGVFPGAGRSLLWHWVSALVRVLSLIVAMGIFLALLVSGLTGLLGLTRGVWERFLLVTFFMAVMWVGRRQLVDITARFADSTLNRLEGARLGGSHGATWIPPYQAGGLTGLGIAHTINQTSQDHPHLPTRASGSLGADAAGAALRWASRSR